MKEILDNILNAEHVYHNIDCGEIFYSSKHDIAIIDGNVLEMIMFNSPKDYVEELKWFLEGRIDRNNKISAEVKKVI